MNDLISRQAAINEIEFGIIYAKAIDKETGEAKELFQERNDELRCSALITQNVYVQVATLKFTADHIIIPI